MRDEQIRDLIRREFDTQFTKKFNNGIREHNPTGDKGLWKMPILALINSVKEEVHDLLSYVTVIEKKILADQTAEEMTTKTTQEKED